MKRFIVCCILMGGVGGIFGCSSSSDGEPHKVKDLKSRGMKDPSKDDMKPAKGELPGSKSP